MQRTLLLVIALVAALSANTATAAGQPPNVVFILIDDMGWPDLGCYGNTFHETPNIDQLAQEGVRFTDAYAACPVCSPTRASLMSGQYPARVGITDFITGHWRPYEKTRVPLNETQYLPLEITTIAETLKTAGYTTGMFGKWHLGGMKHFPDKQGFDEMLVQGGGGHFGSHTHPDTDLDKDDYLAEVLTEHAQAFMQKHRDQPFFVFLSHYAVHIPLQARQALIEKYKQKEKPPTGVNNPVYAAMVEHVDNSVGEMMKTLDELGLRENTLVVLFSDNGGLRERFDKTDGVIVSTNAPLRNEKGTLYEGGIRVPMIVRWPGRVPAGATCETPVSSVDVYPTMAAAAGAAPPPEQPLDGVNLLPLLSDAQALPRDALFWHYPHYHHDEPAGAIRVGDWKLIENYVDGSLSLFNLAEDIGEAHNLADTESERAAALRRRLQAWRASLNAKMPLPNPDYDPDRAGEWGRHPDRN